MNNNQLKCAAKTGFFSGEPNGYNNIDEYKTASSRLHPELVDMLKRSMGNLYEISSNNSGVYISNSCWVNNYGKKIGFKLEQTIHGNMVYVQSWDCSDMFRLTHSQIGWYQGVYSGNLTDLLYQLRLRSDKLDVVFGKQNAGGETKDDIANKVLNQMQNAKFLRGSLFNYNSDLIPECIAVDQRPSTTVLITGNKPYGLAINMPDSVNVYVLTLWDVNSNNLVWSQHMGYADYAKVVLSYTDLIAEINSLFN